ncbi:DUF4249 domain-containing protein [Taibaiella sp. KBW10]|uniref:DUF4249 family protein n=1 Tax=Taibaiella sp. KBW10 TaxID=2153357 RepID=UPI000F5B2FD5|nr:DUF4249 family protein [Taibaiella sp. KBW10]RQO30728.1 DUF4249 domain-containing protein [Taibaiella sp. KBW10]
MKRYLAIVTVCIGSLVGLISCEKEVNFNLPTDISEKVVVEGSIEVGQPPFVLLTKSLGFFSKIDLGNLQNSFLHAAVIKVTDGSRTIQLREYTIDTLSNTYSFYTVDTANPADLTFLGLETKTYKLSIDYQGKSYEATTTIPKVKALDSIWAEVLPQPITNEPDYRVLKGKYTDPDTLGNCVRIFTNRNDNGYLTDRFSTYNDDIVNGTTVDLDISNGISPMDTFNFETYRYFKRGDKVTVKWSAIDKATYTFWQTLEFSVGTTGNPFSTPIKVGSNISNGALGAWAGYSSSYKTLTISQ